ncbi:MAG: TonB-dependent receptor [Bradyrhizobium sp.]|nr:TonB-dependent receptor [Bradyrhizobium sp.]
MKLGGTRRNCADLRLGVSVFALVAITGFSTAAWGEEAPGRVDPPVQTSSPSTDTTPVEGDIVVTARKKSELLRDVPVAVTAFSGDMLRTANAMQLPDIVAITPNFTISYGSIAPFTFVRGFGSGGNVGFEQTVGKFYDNVSFGRDQDGRIPLFDIERVEVLKGPQVVVFGNSSTAGALNITTKKAGPEFGADLSTSYEFNNHEVQTQGGINVPLADFASFRLAGMYQDLDRGWIYNPATGRHEPARRNYAIRPSLHLTAGDLQVFLKAEYDNLQERGGIFQPVSQPTNPAVVFPEVDRNDLRSVSNEGAPFFNHDFSTMENQTYQGDLQYEVLGGTLSSTTAYRKYTFGISVDGDGSPDPIYNATVRQDYKQFSQELRFSGKFGRLDYTLGGYYQDDTLNAISIQNVNLVKIGRVGAPPFARFSTLDQKTRAFSFFGDFTYHLTNAFSIAVGGRYVDTRKDADQASNGANIILNETDSTARARAQAAITSAYDALLLSALSVRPHTFTGLHLSEQHFQPQVIAQYKLSSTDMIYAKFVQGVKAGGFDYLYSGNNPNGVSFQPEKAKSYEVGVKGLAFDRKVEFSFTGFWTTFTNLQVSLFNTASFVVANVGKATTKGFEAEVNYSPIPHLKINAVGAYLDAQYDSFPGAACTAAQTAATPVGQVCTQDLSHTPTPYASKWSGSISVNYEHPFFGGLWLGEGVSVDGRSKYNAGTFNNPLQVQEAYAQVGAHLDLRPDHGWWSVSLFGRNLTNKQYTDFAAQTILVAGGRMEAISRGRQIGLRFNVKF